MDKTDLTNQYPEYYAERLLFRARDLLDVENPKHLELKKSINNFLADTAHLRNPSEYSGVKGEKNEQ